MGRYTIAVLRIGLGEVGAARAELPTPWVADDTNCAYSYMKSYFSSFFFRRSTPSGILYLLAPMCTRQRRSIRANAEVPSWR